MLALDYESRHGASSSHTPVTSKAVVSHQPNPQSPTSGVFSGLAGTVKAGPHYPPYGLPPHQLYPPMDVHEHDILCKEKRLSSHNLSQDEDSATPYEPSESGVGTTPMASTQASKLDPPDDEHSEPPSLRKPHLSGESLNAESRHRYALSETNYCTDEGDGDLCETEDMSHSTPRNATRLLDSDNFEESFSPDDESAVSTAGGTHATSESYFEEVEDVRFHSERGTRHATSERYIEEVEDVRFHSERGTRHTLEDEDDDQEGIFPWSPSSPYQYSTHDGDDVRNHDFRDCLTSRNEGPGMDRKFNGNVNAAFSPDDGMVSGNYERPPISPQSVSLHGSEYSGQSSAMRGAQEMLKRNRQRRLELARKMREEQEDRMFSPTSPSRPVSEASAIKVESRALLNSSISNFQRLAPVEAQSTWETGSDMTSNVSGSSVWTDGSASSPDRTSRRALILQMAKARMKVHNSKLPTSPESETSLSIADTEGTGNHGLFEQKLHHQSLHSQDDDEKKVDTATEENGTDIDIAGDLD
jgi:hypothetical protein